MDVTTERQGGVLSVQVGGRIDGANAAEFEETIRTAIEESDRAVIMDFEKLAYISSAGPSRHPPYRQIPGQPERQVRTLLPVRSDPGDLLDKRFRQGHRDPPV